MNKLLFPIVAAIGFLSLLMLYLAGAGYQGGSFVLGQAFNIMTYSAYGGIFSVGLVIFYLIWQRPEGMRLFILFLSAVAGLAAFYLPYRQQQIALRVPPIHDITTNLANPPQFVALASQHAAPPNPQCPQVDVSRQQKEFYPDVMTRVYVQHPDEVFDAVKAVMGEKGWELIDGSQADGRVEATVTTRWFGFKDDVVVRLEPGPADSTVLDMRSVSRVGCSDIGVNANRIRAFITALNEKLMVEG